MSVFLEEKSRFDERKKLNQPFLKAFEYLRREKRITQALLAIEMHTNSSMISAYKKGTKLAGDDIKRRLREAFEGRLNPLYLDGESDVMLLADTTTPTQPPHEPTPEMSIIELAATLIKENEALRRQLQEAIAEVSELRTEMSRDREAIATIRTSLSQLLYQSAQPTSIPMAAENDSPDPSPTSTQPIPAPHPFPTLPSIIPPTEPKTHK